MMRRRRFMALLGGAAAWPVAARAQQAGKLPTIGFFGPNTASAWRPWTAAFVQRLRELGWIEPQSFPHRGLREKEKRWRIGLPGASEN